MDFDAGQDAGRPDAGAEAPPVDDGGCDERGPVRILECPMETVYSRLDAVLYRNRVVTACPGQVDGGLGILIAQVDPISLVVSRSGTTPVEGSELLEAVHLASTSATGVAVGWLALRPDGGTSALLGLLEGVAVDRTYEVAAGLEVGTPVAFAAFSWLDVAMMDGRRGAVVWRDPQWRISYFDLNDGPTAPVFTLTVALGADAPLSLAFGGGRLLVSMQASSGPRFLGAPAFSAQQDFDWAADGLGSPFPDVGPGGFAMSSDNSSVLDGRAYLMDVPGRAQLSSHPLRLGTSRLSVAGLPRITNHARLVGAQPILNPPGFIVCVPEMNGLPCHWVGTLRTPLTAIPLAWTRRRLVVVYAEDNGSVWAKTVCLPQ